MQKSWLIDDMIRICPQTGNVIEEESRHKSIYEHEDIVLRMTSPRNAYVSLQLIVKLELLSEADPVIELGPLRSDDIESPADYDVYMQWYHVLNGRFIPDALVPFQPYSNQPQVKQICHLNAIPDQSYTTFWIDMFVPRETQPGNYEGDLLIKMGDYIQSHSFTLQVLRTSVPDETLLTADLNNYADNLSRRMESLRDRKTRYQDGSYFQMERQFYRMSHEHRCVFHHLPYSHSGAIPESYIPEITGKGKFMKVEDWSLFDEHFGPYLDGSAFEGTKRGPIPLPYMYLPFNFHWPADYAKWGTKGYKTEFAAMLEEFHDHFTEKGWLSTQFELFLNHKKRYKLFPYDGDETRFLWDEKVNDIFYDFSRSVLERKEGAQFIFRTDASWSYGLHYSKYADIIRLWVVNDRIFSWYKDGLQHLKEAGCTVWTYGGAPKIDRSFIANAFLPMMTVARGTDGFVYWENTYWGNDWSVTPESGGATTLFYPGDKLFGIEGPLPCIRLKWLRNVMQVADCMESWIRECPDEARRDEINSLIANTLGVAEGSWWPKQPNFVDLPPYEWSDAELSDADAVTLPVGQPPESFN
ncbi:MAG: hypothetical protein K0Q73_8252, partial [Paenibacillus sp.]|nr:hypothetical protein [Paenibacillus sp.]